MLELRDLSFGYGAAPVLAGIDLTVPEGELVSLVGPSGSGKTTLLRLAAGLERPSRGAVRWRGAPVAGPSLGRGIVFQDYALFPWMTLRANVELALGLTDQIPARNPGIGRPIGDELGNILGAHEDRLELTAEGCGQGALTASLDGEPCILEQLAGFFRESALVGKGDLQHGNSRCGIVMFQKRKRPVDKTGRGAIARSGSFSPSSAHVQIAPTRGDVAHVHVMMSVERSHERNVIGR